MEHYLKAESGTQPAARPCLPESGRSDRHRNRSTAVKESLAKNVVDGCLMIIAARASGGRTQKMSHVHVAFEEHANAWFKTSISYAMETLRCGKQCQAGIFKTPKGSDRIRSSVVSTRLREQIRSTDRQWHYATKVNSSRAKRWPKARRCKTIPCEEFDQEEEATTFVQVYATNMGRR